MSKSSIDGAGSKRKRGSEDSSYKESLSTNVGMYIKLKEILENKAEAEKHLEEIFSVARQVEESKGLDVSASVAYEPKTEKLLEKALMIISGMNEDDYFQKICSKLAKICSKTEVEMLRLLIEPNSVEDCPLYYAAEVSSLDGSDSKFLLAILKKFKGTGLISKELAEDVIRILRDRDAYQIAEQCKPLLTELCEEEIGDVKSNLLIMLEGVLASHGEARADEATQALTSKADVEMAGIHTAEGTV